MAEPTVAAYLAGALQHAQSIDGDISAFLAETRAQSAVSLDGMEATLAAMIVQTQRTADDLAELRRFAERQQSRERRRRSREKQAASNAQESKLFATTRVQLSPAALRAARIDAPVHAEHQKRWKRLQRLEELRIRELEAIAAASRSERGDSKRSTAAGSQASPGGRSHSASPSAVAAARSPGPSILRSGGRNEGAAQQAPAEAKPAGASPATAPAAATAGSLRSEAAGAEKPTGGLPTRAAGGDAKARSPGPIAEKVFPDTYLYANGTDSPSAAGFSGGAASNVGARLHDEGLEWRRKRRAHLDTLRERLIDRDAAELDRMRRPGQGQGNSDTGRAAAAAGACGVTAGSQQQRQQESKRPRSAGPAASSKRSGCEDRRRRSHSPQRLPSRPVAAAGALLGSSDEDEDSQDEERVRVLSEIYERQLRQRERTVARIDAQRKVLKRQQLEHEQMSVVMAR